VLLACVLVLGMGLLAPLEDERPRAYQTVLLVTGLALLGVGIVRLAQVFGESSPFSTSGTVTWMATLFAGIAAVPAWRLRSPICALLEFAAGGVALVAFVHWVFQPKGPDTTRWLLLVLIVVYAATHVRLREAWPRHAVQAANAGGLAGVALAATFATLGVVGVHLVRLVERPGTWWALVLLATGFALAAYAAVDREAGPAYLGFLVLILFVLLVGPPSRGGASLIGWPILLLLLGGGGVAAGLRPRRDLPPEPGPTAPPSPPRPLSDNAPTEVLPVDEREGPRDST
jgi:hypothetical protein